MKQAVYLTLTILCMVSILGGCTTSKLGKAGQKKMAGKTFVIVGASSGFGRGIAEELGRYKANVVIAARRTDLLQEIARIIDSSGGSALVVTTDISKPEDVEKLADEAVKKYGRVDIWINMAGLAAIGRFWDIPAADQARIIDVNLKGFIYGSHAAVNIFRRQGYGTLINMGSGESEIPLAYQGTYSASKAGIRSLSLALGQELRLNGYKKIKVVTIEPWGSNTPWSVHAANYSGGTPRMPALDPPAKTINAVLRKSLRPAKEVPVGWKAKGSWAFHRYFPRLTEHLSANVVHRYQITTAPPAPDTAGAIYQSVPEGRGVEGEMKERMKRENKERRKSKK